MAPCPSPRPGPSPWLPLALVALALGALAPVAASAGSRRLPYPEAVRVGRAAAEAVLGRSGSESCLRGKLNRALLGLSSSCAAAGENGPLCALAGRAAVVTPMSLAFMDRTARQLLELSGEAPPAGR